MQLFHFRMQTTVVQRSMRDKLDSHLEEGSFLRPVSSNSSSNGNNRL